MPSWKKVVVSGSDAALPSISHTGNFTLDVSGDITLDADGADVLLKDNGTEFGRFKRDSSDFVIKSATNNKDILLKGQDGGATITALQLDMSESGDAYFNNDISGSTIRASGDVIAFNSSDERYKDNIQPLSSPLWKINQIGGYEFDWNDKAYSHLHGHDVGVIAQEVETVLPEAVTTREDGYKAVKYEKIIPLLIEGFKEQEKRINALEKKLNSRT